MALAAEVRDVAAHHGIALPGIEHAASESERYRNLFTDRLSKKYPVPGSQDIVLLGSFARDEVTNDSDCDYLVLVHGSPDLEELRNLRRAFSGIVKNYEFRPPGTTGTFGDFATTTELIGRIGLDGDSNANTTRRLLLLMESVSIYNPDVREQFLDQMIRRYCGDYEPGHRAVKDRITCPRFLLNDVIRYWRTLAVDFGAKKWRALTDDWYVRYAKLLTTRKVLFAGSLAAMLTVPDALRPKYDAGDDAQVVYDALVSHLKQSFDLPPLARLMALHPKLGEEGKEHLAAVLAAYEDMITLLSEKGIRDRLNDEVYTDLRNDVDRIAAQIGDGLEQVFFTDPLLAAQTRRLCVF